MVNKPSKIGILKSNFLYALRKGLLIGSLVGIMEAGIKLTQYSDPPLSILLLAMLDYALIGACQVPLSGC